jgi:DNA/RNA-binding domain of Phe-tRNA-synthetase-like protein
MSQKWEVQGKVRGAEVKRASKEALRKRVGKEEKLYFNAKQ